MIDWQVVGPILGGLVAIIGLLVRAYIQFQRRIEQRDEEVAQRERRIVDAMTAISMPLVQMGTDLKIMRDEHRDAWRMLSLEMQQMAMGQRAATNELVAEIRAAFRNNNRGHQGG